MKQRTWPDQSQTSPFSSLNFLKHTDRDKRTRCTTRPPANSSSAAASSSSSHHRSNRFSTTTLVSPSNQSRPGTEVGDFAALPFDILTKIAAPFTVLDLHAASSVCRSWREGLRPLREAIVLLRWGKRFKHGRGGVRANLDKALDSFLKGAARGSTLAMVDAGLVYWETGRRDEAVMLYRRAAELGDPAGQCNLGISHLQAETPDLKEAVIWLKKSSFAGHARAQYQLALCFHQGRGVDRSLQEAAKLYLKAAQGGYVRAMYNTSLCYSVGEGLPHSLREARKWMKRAADYGHSKAQFEHGLTLFSEGDMTKAVIYLELATRAGEVAANRVKNVILQQLSETSRNRAMLLADNWRVLPSAH